MGYDQKIRRKNIQAVLTIVGMYGILAIAGAGCPLRFLTGISCAGCGMTRAWLSLIQGEGSAAFSYHPFWAAPILAMILLSLRPRLKRHVFQTGMGIICGGLIIVYVIRLFSHDNNIVTFEPRQGAICRGLFRLLGELR